MKFRAFVIAIALLSCSRVELVSRSPEPIARALAAKPHRLSVVFWPEASGCISCDQMISEVMSEWLAAPDAQTVVVTVIPNRERAFQPWLPGVVVRLDREDYRRFAGSAPLPRVEIRDAKGAVLLSRSIPKNGLQAELLKEEMLAARSFTAPVPIAAGVSP
jgi:hypothetical protein